ncbi:cobalt ABC transporter permease [Tropicimonas sp. IMCC6043]|uniref:cobalt ABC transporter permease n=1 Tax=Tropicimonas sp. IMCC6043 TaxID=2510645 RepID=UPI001F5DE1B3|nr:cobalt ABC transporter permease [Tropicimonas sp. IMCC6043]
MLLTLALALAPLPAVAHKVIMGVFPSGDRIEGEVGFTGGKAPVGLTIEVFDPAGTKLGETETDAEGFFVFTPTQPVEHLFRTDLGAGHVAETTMSAADVSTIIARSGADAAAATPGAEATIAWTESAQAASAAPETAPPASSASGIACSPPQVTVAAVTPGEIDAIAKAVRDEMRPLRREISAYKEKNDLQTILGGIGYIVGLFGLGFYLAARRKLKATG